MASIFESTIDTIYIRLQVEKPSITAYVTNWFILSTHINGVDDINEWILKFLSKNRSIQFKDKIEQIIGIDTQQNNASH